jgi:LytS/YehU family sensor histidine kinase
MDFINKYIYLQKMRFENHLLIHVNIPLNQHHFFVPPFVLQMMIENAIKHNIITPSENLTIRIFTQGQWIVVENNLQKKHNKMFSTLTGQQSIRDSYALITDVKPVFEEKETTYIVYLPLLESKEFDKIKRKESVGRYIATH